MRYALIVVAIGASLFLTWLSWIFLLRALDARGDTGNDWSVVVVLATAALVMAFAAGGLVARRAEGAFLLSVGAFMCALPLAFVAMLSFVAWDVTSNPGPERLLGPVGLGLDLWVGVLGLRLGRSMRRVDAE